MIQNKKKLTLVLITLIIFSTIIPVFGAQETIPKSGDTTSGPPDGKAETIHTDIIPNQYMEMVKAGVQHEFQFKNMVMVFTANKNMDLQITARNQVQLQYFSMEMDMQRNMFLNFQVDSKSPEGTIKPDQGIQKYFTFDGNDTTGIQSTLKMYIQDEPELKDLNQSEINGKVSWCFWNDTDWEPIESWIDEAGNVVTETGYHEHFTVKVTRKPGNAEPKPSEKGKIHDYKEVTPKKFMWTVQAREGVTLEFKNTALELNSTRKFDLDITVDDEFKQKRFKLDLSPDEPIHLEMNFQQEKPENVETAKNNLGFYCSIEPNSTATLHAKMGIEIDEVALEGELGREIDPQNLTWAWFNGSDWEPVNSTIDEENIITCETDHFSIWTILEVEAAEPDTPTEPEPEPEEPTTTEPEEPEPEPESPAEQPKSPFNPMIYAAIVFAIAVIAFMVYTRRGQ